MLVFASNLLLDLYDVLVQIWNICVPLIGFVIYFVLDLGLTVFKLVIDVIGTLNLPAILPVTVSTASVLWSKVIEHEYEIERCEKCNE